MEDREKTDTKAPGHTPEQWGTPDATVGNTNGLCKLLSVIHLGRKGMKNHRAFSPLKENSLGCGSSFVCFSSGFCRDGFLDGFLDLQLFYWMKGQADLSQPDVVRRSGLGKEACQNGAAGENSSFSVLRTRQCLVLPTERLNYCPFLTLIPLLETVHIQCFYIHGVELTIQHFQQGFLRWKYTGEQMVCGADSSDKPMSSDKTPQFCVYSQLFVTGLPRTLSSTVLCCTAVRISWVYMACSDAYRGADSPPAIAAVVELEYSTRHGIHTGFIWDCFLHVYWILLWHPGAGDLDPARAWCFQVSWLHAAKAHLLMAAMLKRDENRAVGNKKAPRSNVLEQRISTDQHQTITEFTHKFTAGASRAAAAH